MPDNREIWERMGAIERQLDALLEHLDLQPIDPDAAPEVSKKVLKLAKDGDKAAAAKQHRDETGTSLADAVAVVDKLS